MSRFKGFRWAWKVHGTWTALMVLIPWEYRYRAAKFVWRKFLGEEPHE